MVSAFRPSQLRGTVMNMKKTGPLALAQIKAVPGAAAQAGVACFKSSEFAGSGWWPRRSMAFAVAGLLFMGALAGSAPAEAADGAKAQVTVGATVLRHVSVRVLTMPRTLQISQADIALGYVDVPFASTLEIRSNSPTGYLLAIESQADFALKTEVHGSGVVTTLGRLGGVVNMAAGGRGMQTLPVNLSFRVLLSPSARPGLHPWPLQISLLPV